MQSATRRTLSWYVGSPSEAVDFVNRFSLDGEANIYVTLNAVAEHAAVAKRGSTPRETTACRDGDIAVQRWLFVDIDSQRPSSTSATEEEIAAATSLRSEVAQGLSGEGWPDPVVVMSGNGWNLLYRLPDLPNDEGSRNLIRDVLKAMSQRFTSPGAKVDHLTSNPSRLIGLVGILKTKGEATEERPHRRSYVDKVPAQVMPVEVELLRAMADSKRGRGRPRNSTVITQPRPDLGEALDAAGVEFRAKPRNDSGMSGTRSATVRLGTSRATSSSAGWDSGLTANGWRSASIPPARTGTGASLPGHWAWGTRRRFVPVDRSSRLPAVPPSRWHATVGMPWSRLVMPRPPDSSTGAPKPSSLLSLAMVVGRGCVLSR